MHALYLCIPLRESFIQVFLISLVSYRFSQFPLDFFNVLFITKIVSIGFTILLVVLKGIN